MVRRLIIILFVLISLASHAQVGGRLKEHSNQKRFMKHIARSGWHYKPTRAGKMQSYRSEGRNLFQWNRTSNKRLKCKIQGRINKDRSRKRIHGNDVFSKRKYKRV